MKKSFMVIVVLICTLIAFSIPSMAAAPTYLFITSGTDVTIDETLIARIKSLGFDVVVVAHDTYDVAADTAGKVAIYVSESVSSANLVERWNDVAVPMVISEAYMYEDMGLCGPTADVDFGSNTENVKGTVIKPDHPIMKGVSKDYVVITKEGLDPLPNYTWAITPAKNALAVDPANPDRAEVFAFDKGEASVESLWPSYTLPEKRCGINFHTSMAIDAVSEDMWKIFDNAIIWAAGVDPLAPPETEAPVTEAPVVEDAAAAPVVVSPKTADAGLFMFTLAAAALCTMLTFKKKTK
ncbi:MAG: hypothetical protein ACYCWE_21200 [Eubacteriales bacterium]